MHENCELSLIIPAYNEESRLPRTLDSVICFLQKQPFASEIIVVTDGSKDNTAQIARDYSQKFDRFTVIDFPTNKGKGFAVKAGMAAAHGKFRAFMDADGAVSIEHILSFIQKAGEGFDVVIGSRALNESQKLGRQPFPREQMAVCFGYLQRAVLRLKIVDTQCGFKLFKAEAAKKLFPLLTLDCAYFDAELVYVALNLGLSIVQMPVVWKHDNETRLPVGLRRTFDIVRKLFKIRQHHHKTFANHERNKESGDSNHDHEFASIAR